MIVEVINVHTTAHSTWRIDEGAVAEDEVLVAECTSHASTLFLGKESSGRRVQHDVRWVLPRADEEGEDEDDGDRR